MSYRESRDPHRDKIAFTRTASKTKDINVRPKNNRGYKKGHYIKTYNPVTIGKYSREYPY